MCRALGGQLLWHQISSLNSLSHGLGLGWNPQGLGHPRAGRERRQQGKEKAHCSAFGITQWIKEMWVSGCRALWPRGAWERWEVLHLWIVLQLWRRLLNLARCCWLLLRWSVAVCNSLAVCSWICVRLGCLCDVFMYLIWEVSARQKFLMAWCN